MFHCIIRVGKSREKVSFSRQPLGRLANEFFLVISTAQIYLDSFFEPYTAARALEQRDATCVQFLAHKCTGFERITTFFHLAATLASGWCKKLICHLTNRHNPVQLIWRTTTAQLSMTLWRSLPQTIHIAEYRDALRHLETI